MPDLKRVAEDGSEVSSTKARFFMRFTREQRYLHGVLFTTFLGLAATGLPMRFAQTPWARRFASGVGGFGAIIFFHKLFAVVLTIAFLIHLKEILDRKSTRLNSSHLGISYA